MTKIVAAKRLFNDEEKTVAGTSTKLIPETPIKKKKQKSTKKRSKPINDTTHNKIVEDINDDDLIQSLNLCQTCGVDMGEGNPRQLCGKTKCLNEIEKKGDDSDELTEDSDGSDENQSSIPLMEKRERKGAFLSLKEFTAKVAEEKPLSWSDLDQEQIYYIKQLKTKMITDGERKRLAYVAEIETKSGISHNAWFPGCAGESVAQSIKENPGKDIYIQPLGKKYSPKSGRTYNNFNVLAV